MNIQDLVFSILKPKVASLGFNAKEVKGIAAAIADNLDIAENATEEEATSRINESVGAIIPILQIGQSQSNRLLDAYKAAHPIKKEGDGDGDGEGGKKNDGSNNEPSNKQNDEQTKLMAQMMETMKAMQSELNNLKTTNITTSRKAKLEALVKDKGAFGSRIVKNFERMSFKDEEEFDAFMEEVKEDVTAYDKERSEAGLGTMGGKPNPQGGSGSEDKLTDKEIENIVALS